MMQLTKKKLENSYKQNAIDMRTKAIFLDNFYVRCHSENICRLIIMELRISLSVITTNDKMISITTISVTLELITLEFLNNVLLKNIKKHRWAVAI